MKTITAFVEVNGKRRELTYTFLILWTGEDYEVTVYKLPDPSDENGCAEYIMRRTGLDSIIAVKSIVKQQLRMDLFHTIQGEVSYE